MTGTRPSSTSRAPSFDLPTPRARARWLASCVAILALVGVPPSFAQESDLPLSAVAVGDVGFGRTEGPDGPATFDVEVLGVRAPSGPGTPLLLVRTSGPFLDEVGGVAAGMSGSPVFLGPPGEERLVGALAYAFPDSDHRLALITPIAAMRALADEDGAPPPAPGGATPLAPAPLLLAGASDRAAALLAPALGRAGAHVVPIQAGSGTSQDSETEPDVVIAGDAVAVALIRGDVRLAAIGTATDVRGDEVLLLGHPFLRVGPTDLALFAADVPAIVANRTLPFKLADLGTNPIGTVTRDGQAGLRATLGRVPDDLPVVVRVDGPSASLSVTARLARLPGITPALLALTVQEAVDALSDRVAGGTAEVALEIAVGDGPPVRLLDQRFDDDDLALEVARLAAAPLVTLLDNPFRDPELRRIAVRVELRPGPEHAEIVEVALETPEVAPGGTVQAFVRVQPYRSEARVLSLAVPIPDDADAGDLVLTFRGASVRDPRVEENDPPPADPLAQATSGLPAVLSWGELIAALENRPQAREMLIEMPGETRPRRLARHDVGTVVTGLERVTVRVVAAEEDGDATGGER